MSQIAAASSGSATTTAVYQRGEHPVDVLSVGSSDGAPPPPKPLLVATPTSSGEFPVLVLLHGYLLYNSFYSQLMQHIASHGFVVVSPQLYATAGPDSEPEIKSTAAILNWLPAGLPNILPATVTANLTKLALSGHSRGGKVAFALVLDHDHSLATPTPTISALIAIDPVDGMDRGKQTNPPVLTYTPLSFDLRMPAMVIGTGLGEIRRNPLFPPCAPAGVNHRDFFDECRAPACHLVAGDYGHLDMLDDETRGLRGRATHCLCKNGKAREPMRRFVGGAAVAFMKAHLKGEEECLVQLKEKPETAPVDLSVVSFRWREKERSS